MSNRVPVVEVRRVLPATLEAAEEFFTAVRMQSHHLLSRASYFTAELLLREALTNAVVHGCLSDPNRRIRCVFRLTGDRLLIAVEDDGEGFDWRAAWCSHATIPDCSGRGVEILRKYAHRVRYNCRGNAVTIIQRFQLRNAL